MTGAPRRRLGWPVWVLFILGLLAVPVDALLILAAGGIAMYNNDGWQGGDQAINIGWAGVALLAIAMIAAMIMRRRGLAMVLAGLLLAPALVLGGLLLMPGA